MPGLFRRPPFPQQRRRFVPPWTPWFTCGAELATDPSTSSHWFSVSAGITKDATHVQSGSSALKIETSASAASLRKVGVPASTQHVIVRMSVYFTAAPTGGAVTLFMTNIGNSRNLTIQTNGIPQLWTQEALAPLPLNEWVDIDVEEDTSANPHTYDWRINGVAQPQATDAVAAVNINDLYFGAAHTTTATFWIDDLAISFTDGDYPIRNGSVVLEGSREVYVVSAEGATQNLTPGLIDQTSHDQLPDVTRVRQRQPEPHRSDRHDQSATVSTAQPDHVGLIDQTARSARRPSPQVQLQSISADHSDSAKLHPTITTAAGSLSWTDHPDGNQQTHRPSPPLPRSVSRRSTRLQRPSPTISTGAVNMVSWGGLTKPPRSTRPRLPPVRWAADVGFINQTAADPCADRRSAAVR